MIGAAQYHCEPVTRRVFGEIFIGDSRVFLQPFGWCEFLKSSSELGVDFAPRRPEVDGRNGIATSFVRIGNEGLIEFRMQTLANREHRDQTIMDGCQVAQEIEKSILAGSNWCLEFLV